MKPHVLLKRTNNFSLSFPHFLQFPTRNSLLPAFLNRNISFHSNLLRFPRFQKLNVTAVEAVRFDGPVMDVSELEDENCELVVETCITRTLPPTLTLERGIESMKKAVEELKLNPPCTTSGVFRFQVAVPPSPKALNWFCCQPESDGVFPRFFLSKETENVSYKSLYVNGTRGVFGIGAAIYFTSSSPCTSEKQRRIRRYLSTDSVLMTTYGFVDVNFNTESFSVEHKAGSFYFLIPEIEINEHEEVSILAVTLAWDENLSFTQAIQSFESSIRQASCYLWPNTERCLFNCLKPAFRKVNLVEDETIQMACANTLLLDRRDYHADTLELVSPFS